MHSLTLTGTMSAILFLFLMKIKSPVEIHEQTILGDVYAMDSAIIMIITMRWEIQQLHLHIYCMHARTNEQTNERIRLKYIVALFWMMNGIAKWTLHSTSSKLRSLLQLHNLNLLLFFHLIYYDYYFRIRMEIWNDELDLTHKKRTMPENPFGGFVFMC